MKSANIQPTIRELVSIDPTIFLDVCVPGARRVIMTGNGDVLIGDGKGSLQLSEDPRAVVSALREAAGKWRQSMKEGLEILSSIATNQEGPKEK